MINPKNKQLQFPVVQSPLAGCSDLPFRLISRRRGLQFCYFEMISANGFVRAGKQTLRLLRTVPEDSPIGAQLVGGDPDSMAASAQMIEDMGFEYLDLNLGCPVRKIVGQGAGSALLANPKGAAAVFEKVVGALKKIPVTVKMRKGFKDDSGREAVELAKIAEQSGIAAVTVHGRTQAQGYAGKADWDIIRQVKESVRIPVVGNGDIFSAQDALRMRETTGCDGIMVGRGSLGNPWLFAQIHALLDEGKVLPPPTLEEKRAAILEHFNLEMKYLGEAKALLHMRKIGSWYIFGVPNAASFRRRLFGGTTVEEVRTVLFEALNYGEGVLAS